MTGTGTRARSRGWVVSADGWTGATASARGSAHRQGQPNQDAARVATLGDHGLVAAVADGHGGLAYTRSEIGARLAVDAAVETISTARPSRLAELFPQIVDHWRRSVASHLEHHPLPVGASDRWQPYGTTLLVAVARDDLLELAQVGDGDAVVAVPTGTTRPVPADLRLVADVTTSLSLQSAVADARFAEVEVSDPDAATTVLLATDGLGKSFGDPGWWRDTAEDYAVLVDRLGPDAFLAQLPTWLGESAAMAGDDTTVALVRRSAPRHGPLG